MSTRIVYRLFSSWSYTAVNGLGILRRRRNVSGCLDNVWLALRVAVSSFQRFVLELEAGLFARWLQNDGSHESKALPQNGIALYRCVDGSLLPGACFRRNKVVVCLVDNAA